MRLPRGRGQRPPGLARAGPNRRVGARVQFRIPARLRLERIPGGVGGLVAGLLVALAAGVGLGALLFGSGGSGSGAGGAADTRAVRLPKSLDQFKDRTDLVAAHAKPSTASAQRANEAKVHSATVAAYSKAFGGAAADYRAYADGSFTHLVYVIAVRADAPGLTIGPTEDLASYRSFFRLAYPTDQVTSVGAVSCRVSWAPTPVGQTPSAEDERTVACQRSARGVTVFVGGSGFTGPSGLQAMAGLTSSALTSVTG